MIRMKRLVENGFHSVRIGDEVGREIAAVELHTFDDFEQGVHRLRFFDGDDAVFADLVHRFGDDRADRLVAVSRNGADLCDHIAADRLGMRCDFCDNFRQPPFRCRA